MGPSTRGDLARHEGFEPPTRGFGVRCSGQAELMPQKKRAARSSNRAALHSARQYCAYPVTSRLGHQLHQRFLLSWLRSILLCSPSASANPYRAAQAAALIGLMDL